MTGSAIMPTYTRYPVTLVRGKGMRVWDADGRSYLDFAAGIAVLPLGHAHPAWVKAVQEQAATLVHVSNLYATEPQERLAARLSGLTGWIPLPQVFFANSGAEANEAALKLARKYGRAGGRLEVVALEGSFHGRTFATLAATGQPAKRAPFEPLPEGFVFVPADDPDALDRAVGPATAAVLVEPVLGEGGVIPLDAAYLGLARRLCDERGALLIFDEVQTGIGRSGSWFAHQRLGVEPDVLTLAKGLGGGLPIGAALCRPSLAFGPGEHASTFGGGPVVCAGALAVLETIDQEGLRENARLRGEQLVAGLRATRAEGILDVRGLGLLVGVRVEPGLAGAVVRALMEGGFLATEAGPDVVRLSPPLIVSPLDVDLLVTMFPAAVHTALARSAEATAS